MTQISTRKGLHRIVYCSAFSRSFPTDRADQDEAIGLIVRSSIRNNRADAITGLLLAHQGWFTQALEGPAEAVMTTYSRILKDPRHTDVTMFGAGPAERREFSDWNMCARRLSPTDDAILATLDLKGAFDPRGLGLGAAMRLLIAVKGIQSRVETEAPFNAA